VPDMVTVHSASNMNNDNPACNEQTNVNGVNGAGALYTYSFRAKEHPTAIRLAQCDSNPRMAKLITPQYKSNGAWVSCAQIDTAQTASADDFQHSKRGSAAMHDISINCP